MPFDGTQSTPSLTLLADILRDRSRWPARFVWNYDESTQCAVGIAAQLWATHPIELCASRERADTIFYGLSRTLKKPMSEVTPEDVADAIDAHLANAA